MRPLLSGTAVAGFVVALMFASASVASAAKPAPRVMKTKQVLLSKLLPTLQEGGPVALTVTAIRAFKDGAVDTKLRHLGKVFEKSFKDYKGFEHIGEHTATLDKGADTLKAEVAARKLAVKFLGAAGGDIRFEVDYDGAKMVMKVKPGGLWFHAGRKHAKGGIVVLALTARSAGK